jgi:hypothetical protein
VADATAQVFDGRRDLGRAAQELAGRLPEELRPLAVVAYNYRWSWTPGGAELFSEIDAERFELSGCNPARMLRDCSDAALGRAAGDQGLVERVRALAATLAADLAPSSAPSTASTSRCRSTRAASARSPATC